MSEWHELHEQEQFFRKEAEKHSGFQGAFAKKLADLCALCKRWIVEEHNERQDYDD